MMGKKLFYTTNILKCNLACHLCVCVIYSDIHRNKSNYSVFSSPKSLKTTPKNLFVFFWRKPFHTLSSLNFLEKFLVFFVRVLLLHRECLVSDIYIYIAKSNIYLCKTHLLVFKYWIKYSILCKMCKSFNPSCFYSFLIQYWSYVQLLMTTSR